jgi:hypothetical protein
MKTTVCHHSADSSTAYMLQNLSRQDWFTPAKALSRSPFPEDYIPPGTPFQEWDYSTETFLGGTPLQTSTPNVVKEAIRRHIPTEATPSAPNTPEFVHTLDDVDCNTTNVRGWRSDRLDLRHFNHDRIFSSFDPSTMLSTSIFRPNCMNLGGTPQDDPALSTVASLLNPGPAVVTLSGMLDCLDIDGMSHLGVC